MFAEEMNEATEEFMTLMMPDVAVNKRRHMINDDTAINAEDAIIIDATYLECNTSCSRENLIRAHASFTYSVISLV